MADTNIEWADKTWNPIIGCTKVSPGCDHCYAERMACRLAQNPMAPSPYQDVVSLDGRAWNGKTVLVESALEQPLKWRKPSRIFVGSMTDLFHKETPDEWLDRIFAVMALCPQHTFLVLTKRPDGMREYATSNERSSYVTLAKPELFLPEYLKGGTTEVEDGTPWPLPNVFLGVSAENQAMADYRIPILQDTPAAKRFVSIEPMLGAMNLRPRDDFSDNGHGPAYLVPSCNAAQWSGLDWIICGGESGPGARPMNIAWARYIKDQCFDAGVPFFYKQGPGDDGCVMKMPLLDGRTWDQVPE